MTFETRFSAPGDVYGAHRAPRSGPAVHWSFLFPLAVLSLAMGPLRLVLVHPPPLTG